MTLYSKLATTASETLIKKTSLTVRPEIDWGGPGITIGFNNKTFLLVGMAAVVGYVIVSIGIGSE